MTLQNQHERKERTELLEEWIAAAAAPAAVVLGCLLSFLKN